MTDRSAPGGGALRARTLLVLGVAGLLLAAALVDPSRRAAAAPRGDDVVPAVTRALADAGLPGTFAVAVAQQVRPVAGMSVRAAESRTPRTRTAVAGNGAAALRPFPTASLVKLYVAEDVLHQAREGRIRLDADDLGLLERMISSSDDAAASALWVRHDGPRMVRDVARRYGLTGTASPAVPGQWGSSVTSARDLARFLGLLPVRAHPEDAERILGWMRAATPTAADGFDQRFGLFGTAGGRAGVKQGWMCCFGGQRHVHTAGVLGGTVVVVLAEVPSWLGYDEIRRALTAAAQQLPAPRSVRPQAGSGGSPTATVASRAKPTRS